MASVQKSANACKLMHHDHQQLSDVKSVLVDCTKKLNNTDNSQKEIAKLTKLTSQVLNVIGDETQAGLKSLARHIHWQGQ
jgi:hypothetical protein